MRKSLVGLTVLALGAMVAVGSATESMARGSGGGHDGGSSHSGDHGGNSRSHDGGDHGMGRGFSVGDNRIDPSQGRGRLGSGGIFGGERDDARVDERRDHFKNSPGDGSYGHCEYPGNPFGCK